jgi:hypothetical protein
MDIAYDEKGKMFTDVITKNTVRAKIQTTTHLIIGELHVRRDSRMKDELDLQESFLAVTNASLYASDGQKLFSTGFLAVQRSQIVWVIAADDEKEGQPL